MARASIVVSVVGVLVSATSAAETPPAPEMPSIAGAWRTVPEANTIAEVATVWCTPRQAAGGAPAATCSITRTDFRKRPLEVLLAEAAQVATELRKPGAFDKLCAVVNGAGDAGASVEPARKACASHDPAALNAEVERRARDVEAQTCTTIASSMDRVFTRVDSRTWVSKYEGLCVDDVLTLSKDAIAWKLRIARTYTPKPSCSGNAGGVELTDYVRRREPLELGCKYFE